MLIKPFTTMPPVDTLLVSDLQNTIFHLLDYILDKEKYNDMITVVNEKIENGVL